MGNNCVGSRGLLKDGVFQSISNTIWWSEPQDKIGYTKREISAESSPPDQGTDFHNVVQNKPPEMIQIFKDEPRSAKKVTPVKDDDKQSQSAGEPEKAKKANGNTKKSEKPEKQEKHEKPQHKKPQNVKRVSSAGLQAKSVLKTKTGHLKEYFNLGRKLGHGQFGTTFLCVEKTTGKEYACKSIAKRKLVTEDDVEDVRREIEILHHLSGDPNVVSIKGAYEDAVAVHVIMELCGGGELFDRITKRGHYTERKAANLARTILKVVESCHSMGVMHRDLKPENFLFVNEEEESALKTIDFGLSVFFKPGMFQKSSCNFYFCL